MSTRVSSALLVAGICPVAYMAQGLNRAGMCDPGPILAGLWLLVLTFIGSIVGFVSIYAARKTGRNITSSVAITVLNILCFMAPIFYLLFIFATAH
jgi:hypothetical protein